MSNLIKILVGLTILLLLYYFIGEKEVMESSSIVINSDNSVSNMTHNNIFGFVKEFRENYKEFVSNLNSEQLACLTNALVFFIIISALNSVIIAYYGDQIINYFNLGVKYPKLAKIISIKSKISDKVIKLHILYIYIASLTMLFVNIYMLYF